ncbi:MAG: dTMP kinase [Patescibacteria group bacterium]
MNQKLFIAFEGIDGSGKTTQALLLKAELERSFSPTIITKAKNPEQNKAFGDFVKEFDIASNSMAFMFLYQALHRQQFEATKKALDNGHSVIADRWNGSFFTYHMLFGPLSARPKKLLADLDRLAFENLQPDITILLDISVAEAFLRRKRRGEQSEFDEAELSFYEQIRQQNLILAKKNGWRVIDATGSIEEIHQEILAILKG